MADKFLTPQQELFLAEYTNPKSANFGNALQSALKAGYKQEYAESITSKMPDWLLENVGDLKRLRKAEKTLDEILELPNEKENLQAKTKVSTFVAERLGKNKYSIRTELTGNDGKELKINLINYADAGNNDTLQLQPEIIPAGVSQEQSEV